MAKCLKWTVLNQNSASKGHKFFCKFADKQKHFENLLHVSTSACCVCRMATGCFTVDTGIPSLTVYVCSRIQYLPNGSQKIFMKVGGEGVETRLVDKVLQIRSQSRMLGYLNAPSPFDAEGWYDTKDVVEVKDGYYKVVGRISDVINVGGLKFMASEVEHVALNYPNVSLVKATPKQNPITGQHVELLVQPKVEGAVDKDSLMAFLKEKLQPHMVPKRIRIESVSVGHRFKKE